MQKTKFGVALTPLEKITLTAAMTALSIVLCRFLGYSPANTMFRVEIGFLPIALVGLLAGPLYSFVGYGLSDLIGSLVTTGMNPLILACKAAFGLILGLFLYRRRPSLPLILLTLFVVGAGVDVFLMSAVFKTMGYAPSYAAALYTRTINALVNYPIRVAVLYLVCRFGLPPLLSALKRRGRTVWGAKDERPGAKDEFSYSETEAPAPSGKTADGADFKTYANSFQTVSRLGLERETDLLARLGNPEKNLRCLHIAGTNGKGSVAAYLSAILCKAGSTVGLYTSPNLVRVNERISLNDEPIGDADLDRLLEKVEGAAKDGEAARGEAPTQFEIWTAIAFLYFAEKKVDYVVLETGLGGEFDATNVIEGNVAAILTKIDLDHVEYLGDTVEKIAETKSKIIKAACETGCVFSAPQSPEAERVIRRRAAEVGVTPVFSEPPAPGDFDLISERFSYRGIDLAPSLGGLHQIENACLACDVALKLGVDPDAIAAGVAAARHPGRFELLSRDPVILYDGGHNPNGITALNRSLDRYFPGAKMTVIFACMKDKEIAPSLRLLAEPGRDFIFTTVQNNPRALPADALREKAAELGIAGESRDNLSDAIDAAKKKGDMILVCGSLYLYADLPSELRAV